MIRRIKHMLVPIYQHAATLRGGHTFVRKGNSPTAFLLLTPDYGNVGDLAIGVAEAKYLERRIPGYEVVSVPLSETYAWLRSIKKQSRQGDLVFLVGGGSTGDLYPRAHFGRVFAIRYLRNLPIISFPQSIIYSSDRAQATFGRRERAAFSSHSALRLFARERTSMTILKKIYDGDIGFAPDIVLSAGDVGGSTRRESSALLVLRGDGERTLTQEDHREIVAAAEAAVKSVVVLDHEVPFDPRQSDSPDHVVDRMMDQYRRSRVVITDRLHGMIFAAITGTPCVVLPNTNHKITGTYEAWLRNTCPYVQFAQNRDFSSLSGLIERVIEAGRRKPRPPALDFSELDAAIAEFAVREQ